MSMNFDDFNLTFKMVIPNLSSKEKGDFFEEITGRLFQKRGWEITRNVRQPGVQIDLELEDNSTKEKALAECKFHKEKIGSTEVGKIISILTVYDYIRGYLLSASELEGEGRTFAENFNNRNNKKLIIWAGKELVKVFTDAYGIKPPKLNTLEKLSINKITFLITYEKEFLWVVEQINANIEDSYAFILPTQFTRNLSEDYWKSYFDKFKIYQKYNLKLIINNDNEQSKSYPSLNFAKKTELKKFIIPNICKADKFVDYHLPCNPENFFGRTKPKNIFWEFIQNIKNYKTNLRIICLTGNTGLGKSSLLVKLIEESTQEQYKYLYIRDIDITGISDDKAKFLLANVIQTTLQEVINKKFINIENDEIKIDSLEPPFFDSNSIKLLRQKLKEEKKIIVIFFDQFEEVLNKQSWESIYPDFLEVANEINGMQENIVFGFSWREDVSISPNNPTYYFWQQIKRISKIINLNDFLFSEQDTEKAIDKFEEFLLKEAAAKKIDNSIKKWIIDNCQNMPWLLKKVCGEIYKETLTYVDFESQQIINNINIKKIFDRDIDDIKKLGNNYYDCLKYIADNSPISQTEVGLHKYERYIINHLLQKKLIIDVGSNYKIYADIFREYIIDGKLPSLTIKFRPNTRVGIALQVFQLLKNNLNKLEVAKKLNLTYQNSKTDTIDHAIRDLQKFFSFDFNRNSGLIKVPEHLRKLSNYEIAEKLADYLVADILIKEIYRKYQPDERFARVQFDQILLESEYVSIHGNIKDYRRCLSWFLFAGLLEIRHDGYIYIPINYKKGKQKGDLKKLPKIQKDQDEIYQPNLLDFLESGVK